MEVSAWVKAADAIDWWLGKGQISIKCYPSDYNSWEEYFDAMSDRDKSYMVALFEDVRKDKVFIDGLQHRVGDGGIPVFNNNCYIWFGVKEWDQLMILMWSKIHGKEYTYDSLRDEIGQF